MSTQEILQAINESVVHKLTLAHYSAQTNAISAYTKHLKG